MKEIVLTKNRIAIVDDDLFEYLSQWRWKYSSSGYAARNIYAGRIDGRQRNKECLMHRFIWERLYGCCLEDKVIDHKDRNPLNNQAENLRLVTQQENRHNSNQSNVTGYKFVEFQEYSTNSKYKVKRTKPYRAKVTINGKRKSLGFYETANEAYNVAIQYLKENDIIY